MLPLAPPKGYWKSTHYSLNVFWLVKDPELNYLSFTDQKTFGGLGLPNFQLYHWSFVLHPFSTWFDIASCVSWRPVEESIVNPHRLQDLIYSNISVKQSKLKSGSIISLS